MTGMAERVAETAAKLRPYLLETPVLRFGALSDELEADVFVKCEHLQKTGSFKARGSMAKILSLSAEEREQGVVTASTGNHGLGVANALATHGGHGIVFVPSSAAPVKVAAIRRLGTEVRELDTDAGTIELKAREYAAEHKMTYVPPYNDVVVIGGQGTVGFELAAQVDAPLDAVFVAVGGGGLISGVASAVKAVWPGVRVYGASPANDAGMAASVQAGELLQVDTSPTLSDGTAGNVEPGSVTFELCRELVDEWVLVAEAEIAAALRFVIDTEHQLIEGSAAVAFAGALASRAALKGKRVGIVSCGANISVDTLVEAVGVRG